MAKNPQEPKKKKNSTNTKKSILIALTLIFFLIIGVLAGGLTYAYNILNKIDKVEINKSDLGINKDTDDKLSQYEKIQNIALFGVDSTDSTSDNGRSDSIMILTIDNERRKLKVSSLMRDCYVDISGHKTDKLNHAYSFGGPQLAIKTINETFDLNIKDFSTVNFTNLPKIIDNLGGIDLEITSEELKYINQYINELNNLNKTKSPNITKTGKQHVDGTQAMAYCRIRYTSGGDYERTNRHRTVLTALLEKFKTIPSSEYPSLLNELLPMVQTNLSSSEILKLASNVLSMGNINLEQERFPKDNDCKGTSINNIYYLTFDKATTIEKMHDYIFNDIIK